jgi:hypothetical protein
MRQRHWLWLGFAGAATTAARLAAWALRRADSSTLPLEWPARERRTRGERRSGGERRAGDDADSVSARIGAATDRRSGTDRRSQADRRRDAA